LNCEAPQEWGPGDRARIVHHTDHIVTFSESELETQRMLESMELPEKKRKENALENIQGLFQESLYIYLFELFFIIFFR